MPETRYVPLSAQERPYASRPSRTQQLLNPNLRPQLSTEVPNDLLRTKGLADELLTKREEERGRKRDLDEFDPLETEGQTSKRARSALLSRQKKGLVHSRATGRMIGILDEGTEYPVQGNVAARRTYPGTEVAEDEVGVGV
ncbi:hypothetical protein EYZ11_008306 [Aspergillus tanneri]|uniref:Uncharacterized protein n=1 Tax=Aspergillus tanneri TaxID=1220188 RepID=A0A4S3JAQ7_9EURO|nr:hypothetical protein EYZ11_008306 [Aspergillus tanneri]